MRNKKHLSVFLILSLVSVFVSAVGIDAVFDSGKKMGYIRFGNSKSLIMCDSLNFKFGISGDKNNGVYFKGGCECIEEMERFSCFSGVNNMPVYSLGIGYEKTLKSADFFLESGLKIMNPNSFERSYYTGLYIKTGAGFPLIVTKNRGIYVTLPFCFSFGRQILCIDAGLSLGFLWQGNLRRHV